MPALPPVQHQTPTLTPGRLLFESIVPEQFRHDIPSGTPIGSKEVERVLQRIAETNPDLYSKVSSDLLKLGAKGSVETQTSFGLQDLKSPIDKQKQIAETEALEKQIHARKDLTEKQKNDELVKLYYRLSNETPDQIYNAALSQGSSLAKMVAAGARGNKQQLSSNIGSDWLIIDSEGKPVPVPLKHSYSEGLDPAESFGSSYGTRQGMISTKFAVADSGFLSKQLSAASQDLAITSDDCGTHKGIQVAANDPDNIGAVLSKSVGPFRQGTIIDKDVERKLSSMGTKKIVVRSPLTCQADHGLCSVCAGVRERGTLPSLNDNIGLAASSAIGEPLSQGLLSSKHCAMLGTLVRMSDWSIKRIEDVKIGDLVLGSDQQGNTFPVRVLNIFNNGERQCQRYSFSLDRTEEIEFSGTADHKILSRWYKTMCIGEKLNHTNQVLPVGTKTAEFFAVLPNHFDDSGLLDEKWASFLGLIIGDGCVTESVNGVHFSCADESLIEETSEYLESLNLKFTKLKGHPYYYRVSQIEPIKAPRDAKTGRMLPGNYQNPAQLAVRDFGLQGKYAHEKTIPQQAYQWSNQSVADLIAGLFVTDGSVYLSKQRGDARLRLGYGCTSRKLMEQIRDLLEWRFGIYCSRVYEADVSKKQWSKRPHYTMTISKADSVKKFITNIPMLGVKRQKISDWLRHSETKCNVDCRKARRVHIEDLGQQPTFDIEVDHPNHLFVLANGLIVSNSAGVANAGKAARTGGFKAINALFQSPKVFPDAATLSELSGRVSKVEDAPQGGKFVWVDDHKHYVHPDQELTVKPGQAIEAGDSLSDGVASPTDFIRLKGLGEGRKYMLNQLQKTMKDNGLPANRRNLEVVVRAVVNHVKIDDPEGFNGYLPDDIARYSDIEKTYVPPASAHKIQPSNAKGMYLHAPVLDYTIGTKITPRIAKDIEDAGETHIVASHEEPPFKAGMVRLMENPGHGLDWMSQLGSSYVKGNLLDNIHRGGATAPIHSTAPLPALAEGLEFGRAPKGQSGY